MGSLAPFATGAIIDATGSDTMPFFLIALLLVLGGLTIYLIDRYADRLQQTNTLTAADATVSPNEILQKR
ncbi:hypothetical protein MN0502_35130 (plasmid) [Arthrobacter sp. MN05-02]|nr:hypothetical protein MN0502_35130 [Arthrobacter sp. MN05-02]